jgi:hypothetical protein
VRGFAAVQRWQWQRIRNGAAGTRMLCCSPWGSCFPRSGPRRRPVKPLETFLAAEDLHDLEYSG